MPKSSPRDSRLTSEQESVSSAAHSRVQSVIRRIEHEVEEWIVMFFYLWVIFGLFALHQSILKAELHRDDHLQGFAILNALILSKVMLIREGLQLAQGRRDSHPILVILNKSIAFAFLFIVFHIFERIIVGVAHGKTITASFPELAGGRLLDIIAIGVIVTVSLIPFFAFREVSRELGEGRLWRLLMARRGRSDCGAACRPLPLGTQRIKDPHNDYIC